MIKVNWFDSGSPISSIPFVSSPPSSFFLKSKYLDFPLNKYSISPNLFSFEIYKLGQAMEEQFILRVPPSIAEQLDRLLSETASSSEDQSLDLSFSEDGRNGTFVIGNEHFPASLLDLPGVVESYKTYDDSSLVKTADIGQMILVRESGDSAPDMVEYRHGLTPPMRDARKRRFRREPDLNPELVQRVEKDLLNIMAGGTVENVDAEPNEQDEDGYQNARGTNKKPPKPAPAPKPSNVSQPAPNAEDPERSDSDDSDDSM